MLMIDKVGKRLVTFKITFQISEQEATSMRNLRPSEGVLY